MVVAITHQVPLPVRLYERSTSAISTSTASYAVRARCKVTCACPREPFYAFHTGHTAHATTGLTRAPTASRRDEM